jgi:hypothetical protein
MGIRGFELASFKTPTARSDGGPLDQNVRRAYPDRKIWRLEFLPSGRETLQELTDGF